MSTSNLKQRAYIISERSAALESFRQRHGADLRFAPVLVVIAAFGVWVFAALVSLLTGAKVTDTSSGYRAMRTEVTWRRERAGKADARAVERASIILRASTER